MESARGGVVPHAQNKFGLLGIHTERSTWAFESGVAKEGDACGENDITKLRVQFSEGHKNRPEHLSRPGWNLATGVGPFCWTTIHRIN